MNIYNSDLSSMVVFILQRSIFISKNILAEVLIVNSSLGFVNASNVFLNMTEVTINTRTIQHFPALIWSANSMILMQQCQFLNNDGTLEIKHNASSGMDDLMLHSTKVIDIHVSFIVIADSRFDSNRGVLSVIFANKSYIAILNSTFSANSATALYANYYTDVVIKDCSFASNNLSIFTILIVQGNSNINMTASRFADNTVSQHPDKTYAAALVLIDNAIGTVIGSNFITNNEVASVTGKGGSVVLVIYYSALTINACSFVNNSLIGVSGSNSVKITLVNTSFSGNKYSRGVSVNLHLNSTLDVLQSSFLYNEGGFGSAIYAVDSCNL